MTTKIVNFESLKECRIDAGGLTGGSIEAAVINDYSYQYAVKVHLPTISPNIGNVQVDYTFNNAWGSDISIHRIALVDINGGTLASYQQESAGSEAGLNTETHFTGPVAGVAAIEIHLAIAVNPTAGSTINLEQVRYDIFGPIEPNNRGEGECDAGESSISNPIGIRHGEKREQVTDLSFKTPTGELTLTRYYSQFSQTNVIPVMGLGWNHNHLVKLTKIIGTPNKISVRLPNGGESLFTETSPNHYDGVLGVRSFVDWNTSTSQYTLTPTDRSIQVFDSSGNLLSRSWPSGETWSYSYSSGKLSQVIDAYGRKLVFRYYTSGSFNGQIYRIGDKTFDDTIPSSPTGRYVEYGYTLNKVINSSGAIANGTQPLLTSVRDVRGDVANPWTYEYYGQTGGETNPQMLNLLMRRKSPAVDTTGDGVTDGSLTLEDVTYTLQATELTVNGGMEADSDWTAITGAAPAVNARSTTQVDSGTYSRHVQVTSPSPANQGIEGDAWDLVAGRNYIISARVYPVSGVVKMQVTGTNAFDAPSSGTGGWQTLWAVYNPLTTVTGRKLQFVVPSGTAEFYVDTVSIVEQVVQSIHQASGNALIVTDYAFQPSGQNITTETRMGKVTTHQFFGGVYGGTEAPAQNGQYAHQVQDNNYRPTTQSDANGNASQLNWSTDGLTLNSVTDALGATTSFAYNSDKTLDSSLDTQGRKTTYVYDSLLRQPNLIFVSKPTNPNALKELAINGDMEGNTGWTSVGTPTTQQQSTTQVDTGTYARRIVASAAGQGMESVLWDWVANHSYLIIARVYPVSGVAKMQVTGTNAFDKVTSTPLGAWQTLRALYTPTTAVTGNKLQFVSSGGAAEFYIDSVHILDLVNPLSVQEFRYDNKGCTILEVTLDKSTAAVLQQTTRTYGISGDENGLLTSVTQVDVVNPANNVSTSYSYDSAGRVVKTQQSSLFGNCKLSYTVYDDAGNVTATVCVNPDDTGTSTPTTVPLALAIYNSTDPVKKKNKVTTYEYDTLGRRVKTTINDGTNNPDKQISLTFYDALGRVVRTIVNYANQSGGSAESSGLWVWSITNNRWEKSTSNTTAITFGTDNNQNIINDIAYNARGMVKSQRDVLGNVTLYGYDDTGRLVKTIQSAYQPSYNNDYTGVSPDPTLGSYTPNSAVDKDIISSQVYDAVGNIVKMIDPLGTINYTVYDALNRPVKTVQAAKDTATISLNTNDSSYDPTLDPRSIGYVSSGNPDRDIISSQEYDAVGNVVKTVDPLGTVNYTVYDDLSRPVKTVQAAKATATISLNMGDIGYDATLDPRSVSYVMSAAPDRDLIQTTEYDSRGGVIRSQRLLENRPTAQWETTLYGYDGLGRQVKVIQKASQPAYVVNSDPTLASYSASSAPDQDIISKTVYDVNGLVLYTEDALGARTWTGYDSFGRPAKTIANTVGTATDNGVNDPRSSSYTPSSVADKDLISTTTYDPIGRVQSTQDTLNRVAYSVYDLTGRVIRTISNYVMQGATNPKDWVWSSTNNRWEYGASISTAIAHGTDNDQNIISDTVFDVQGRVFQSIDNRHNLTQFVYDAVGRRLKTINTYVVQGSSNPANWVWSTVNNRWEDGSGNAISFGTDKDQNRISLTTYDKTGHVVRIRDAAGLETRFSYDVLGRRTQTIANYVDGFFSSAAPDEDLISSTVYNKAGQVVSTADTRGTQTAFTYDRAGRRLTVTQASGSPLSSTGYTCYDKAGRIQRSIQNWSNDPTQPVPDAKDFAGNWSFVPAHNGAYNDRDLVTSYLFDRAGRTVQIKNPVGDENLMAYDKAGQLQWSSDPAYSVTRFFYDQAHRRTRVVQGYQPVPVNQKIVYESFQPGNWDVFTMNVDGTGQVNITNAAGQDYLTDYSPDGSKIVFASDRAGVTPTFYTDIYVMNADGSNQQRLTNLSGYAGNPAWSPDGGQVAFSFKATTYYSLNVMNADGSNLQTVYTNSGLNIGEPKWSPDGQRLIFDGSVDNFATSDIYTIHLDGTQLVNVSNNAPALNLYPSWSWDGSKIVFGSARDGNREIYVMNADGSNQINLSQNTADDRRPNWSPDGSKIVFNSTRDTLNYEVYVMNADGTGQTRLTTNTQYNQHPNWSKTVINPAAWIWSSANMRWEDGSSNPLPHGTDNDRNIIVDVTYDKGGRMLTQREPRGNVTTYAYDLLDRRKSLTNPLTKIWSTAYSDLTGGKSRVTMTYPGITGSANYPVSRDFDRLGRLQNIQFGAPSVIPDVVMTYDDAGNRAKMSEYASASFTNLKRETQLTYDKVHRLKLAAFNSDNTDGLGTIDESVSYEYDAGGLRTKLTLPGSLNVVYTYDQRGQLVSLTDWDSQKTQFAYDNVGRHIATERANGLRSRYQFDAAGRLRVLRHTKDFRTLAHFEYQVDKRGNRIQALEALANITTASNTTIASTDKGLLLSGTWSDVSGYKENTQATTSLKLMFFGNEATLSMGQGPDHSIYDVYINGSLWQSFDGYAAVAAQRDIVVSIGVDSRKLQGEGPHLLEIRNRSEKNKNSTGTKVRFKQLTVTARTWTQQTIGYSYDKLSRVKEARYNPGVNTAAADADLLWRYQYAFDRSGNRTQQIATVGGSATTTDYDYQYPLGSPSANQIQRLRINGGAWTSFTYDNNGNMTSDAVNSYTWDRANRLLSMGSASYQYDGEGRRVQQTVSSTVTKYLLDIQPSLAVVLSETAGSNVIRNVHSPRGIHAQKDPSNNWQWIAQDGLGNVREVMDNSVSVLESRNYGPYGDTFGGTITTAPTYKSPNFGFTGELVDGSGLLDLRARRYNMGMGVFASLDPFEGMWDTPMSINGYGYVGGNPTNWTDPSGNCPQDPWPNDLPGRRCVWLATELSQQYDLPLDVLMQKDVFELETVYTFGNANNTFNKSSWSQTIRDNAGAALIVGGGAALGLLAIALTGGAATPFVLGIASAAASGGLGGAVLGTAYGASMYQIAASGQCGCATQQQVLNMGQGAFIALAREQGALLGTAYGGLLASGPVGQIAAGTGGVIQGGQGVYNAGQDIAANGVNVCNVVNGLLGVAGVLGGISAIKSGYREYQSQRQVQSPSVPRQVTFTNQSTLQHEFNGHAQNFGVTGNWNSANRIAFQNAIEAHIADPNVNQIVGTYRGTIQAIHYLNPSTNLWAATDLAGDFMAGWRLSAVQRGYLDSIGNVQ
ncbi:MAG: PD40 domain-containing protein [Anaerolineae bacterium]|nr:PD40 domain-containing protein [Anaerolineae bacterium]